jgi:succinate-acetate transporter protein
MYEVGMRIVEILVAAGGIDSIMNVYLDMAKGNTFIQSFNNVYGIKWSEAKVVLSKVLVSKTTPSINAYDQFSNTFGGGGAQMKIFVAA